MSHRHARSGFTLVELLIVITIMGVLVSLLSVAVYNALLKAKQAQITGEMHQMDMAMARLAADAGEMFPPDFATFNASDANDASRYFQTDMRTFMAKRFPRYNGKNIGTAIVQLYGPAPNGWPKQNPRHNSAVKLDPAEALVFWLGGFSIPAGADSTKLRGFSANAANPIEGPAQAKRIPSYYAFQEDRLVDRDNDGWYEYVPPGNIGGGNGPPYVYFNSKSYANTLDKTGAVVDTVHYPMLRYPKVGETMNSEWGYVSPYRSSDGGAAWVNPKKFQIVSAGLDGIFGNLTANNPGPKDFPMGDRYEIADNDNQSNFTEGTLEQKKP